MDNPTGLPDLSQFDSAIPDKARQEVETQTEFPKSANSTFSDLLESRDVIQDSDNLEYQIIKLVLKNASTDENRYMNDRHVIGSASFYYSIEDSVAFVGTVGVDAKFQKRGFGTRLKEQLLNHMRQKGATKSYTWIASPGGNKLAEQTGFEQETDKFDDVEEIWVREL